MQTGSAPAHRAAPQVERDRLARLLGMVGSVHDGEALAAARLADKLVRRCGLTWADVFAPPEPALAPSSGNLLIGWPAQWRSAVRMCGRYETSLGDRERSFLQSLATYKRRPSPKQLTWLRSIAERMIEAGGGR
jgi:hypothetical protein